MMILLPLVTAVLAIWGEYQPKRTLVYIFKPLTTLIIIGLALIGPFDPIPDYLLAYKWLIGGGLILCLAGDIFLMLPPRYFLAGLGSFMAGHWFYVAAFTLGGITLAWWWLPLLIYGGGVYYLLHPHLGKMRWPVVIYMLFILLMAWTALSRWSTIGTLSAAAAAGGAVLFVISDSVLALDRFRKKFPSARVIVLSTYWVAQWLIAFSVTGP